jgi:cation-transporting P-type ATPase C
MLLEEYIAEKSKKEIRKLIELDVKKVYILVNNAELEVDLDEVEEGDIVVSRSGEKIPVDGFIQAGSAEIDEALINGRSEPAFKKEGAEVFANTFVQKGRISIKVSAVGSDTYISRVISKVELSLQQKSPSELEADRLASKLLKLGSVLTAGTFFITGSYLRAFSVMIVMSCPCATVLAASTAISAGISRAAKDGILIKGGEYLEKVSQSEAFCFDKTGTLTTGKPIVQEVVLSPHVDEKTLFEFASLAEYRNSHPIAVAIMDYAKHIGSLFDEAYSSEIVPGLGVKATKDKEMILVGNKKFLNNNKISVKDFEKRAEKFLDKGETIVYVSYGKEVLGFISFKHEIRDGTIQMLSDLRKRGVEHLVLLTGDEKKVAKNFARKYGFDEVYSNLMPEDKADIVDELKKKYKNIVMIGDGVNDTIAMSRADVAVSFASGGSEAAIEVSNVAITHSHPEDVVNLYDISRKSLKVVNQNYWIGTSTNLGGVALASVGLLSPVAAGAIHLGHTIAIMANSSRVTWSQKEN